MELLVTPTGGIRCVYGEDVNLHQLGRLSIQRGSHVEPTADGQWTADLSPVNGPVLGPFSSGLRPWQRNTAGCWNTG
jgi:hypothetical protein